MGALDRQVGELFAEAALVLLEQANIQATQICAIGSHGQTIRHHPNNPTPFTLQIGDPNTIAFRTGITTIADFRRMDVAAGGQGAPLVPAFHDATLRSTNENRVVVNIGGMANITMLAKDIPVSGFDTGPGNVLMDSWIQKKRRLPYDQDGAWASSGQCHIGLLEQLLSHPHIHAPVPKSTGREAFHLAWLESALTGFTSVSDADVQRTLLEFTARSIALPIGMLSASIDRVLLCGGGSHNHLLRERIGALLPGISTGTTTDIGIDADWLEAMAFAWLAKQRLDAKPGNMPAATGASRHCILGGVYLPS
jgi:anhydro-N-acetylmuramic acid kinase